MKKIIIQEDAETVWKNITSDLSFAIYPKAMLIGGESVETRREDRTLSLGMKLETYGFFDGEKTGRLSELDHKNKMISFSLEYANSDIAYYSMQVEELGQTSSKFLYDVKLVHGTPSASKSLFQVTGMGRRPDKLVARGIENLFNL